MEVGTCTVELTPELRGFHFRTLRHPGDFVILAADFSEAIAIYRKYAQAKGPSESVRDEILSVSDVGQLIYPR